MVPGGLTAACLVTCLSPGELWAFYIVVVLLGIAAWLIYVATH